MTSFPVNLQHEIATVLALLNSGYRSPEYIGKDVASHFRRREDEPDMRVALIWLVDNEPDVVCIVGALVQYALMDRGMVLRDATFFEAAGYLEVLMPIIFKTVRQKTPWQTGTLPRDLIVPTCVPMLVSVNALIKRLALHGILTATMQRVDVQDRRFGPRGRVTILTRDDYDVRYQPAEDIDPTPYRKYDEGWTDGVTDREYGYLTKQSRIQFPACIAECMLQFADEDQWQSEQV